MQVNSDLINLLRWLFVAGIIATMVKFWKTYKTAKSHAVGVAVLVEIMGAMIGWFRYPEMQRIKANKAGLRRWYFHA